MNIRFGLKYDFSDNRLKNPVTGKLDKHSAAAKQVFEETLLTPERQAMFEEIPDTFTLEAERLDPRQEWYSRDDYRSKTTPKTPDNHLYELRLREPDGQTTHNVTTGHLEWFRFDAGELNTKIVLDQFRKITSK